MAGYTLPGGATTVTRTLTYSNPGFTSWRDVVIAGGAFDGPTVTSISPTSGTALGGTSVTITGTGFTGATAVKFGSTNATSFTVIGGTSITAVAPAGTGTVDVTVLQGGTSPTSAADQFTYVSAGTSVALASSLNPSELGQSVTFTATVTAASTPAGSVTFKDDATILGSGTLDGSGQTTLTTTSLALGVHSITAVYGGDSNFTTSTSAALSQSVAVPADSILVEQVQKQITPIVAQASGQAITGSIEDGIAAGFDGDGNPFTVGAGGVTFNFAGEPVRDRANKAFAALGYADERANALTAPTFDKHWNAWASVRGTGWNGHSAAAGVDGLQVNLTGGVGYKLTPDLLVGAVAGYEHFDYDATSLSGTLKGNGGSVGGYLGWRFGTGLRFDAAAVWSGLAYDATAGTATGSFNGSRWLVSSGLTGSHKWGGFIFEPSGHLYALWESQDAWTDSLTIVHPTNSFSTGRGSLGTKIAYPWMSSDGTRVTPYVGAYGDYRFSSNSSVVSVEDGWSGRVTGGVGFSLRAGATLNLDGELGGFGSSYRIWSAHARAGVPF